MAKRTNPTQLDDELDGLNPSKKRNRNDKTLAQTGNRNTQPRKTGNKEHEPDTLLILEAQKKFSYQASRFEAGWLMESLAEFYQNHWIDDIHHMIKGGKEASVYLCQSKVPGSPAWIAAKVYRPRRFRNLRNDGIYREGRVNLDENGNTIINAGMLVAMKKKTSYGLHLLHQSWIKHEFNTLKLLYTNGCDVPQALASGANCILMEYIGDINSGAPTLHEVSLTPVEAKEIGQRVLFNVENMLEHQRIHGDLSPYNILIWENKITLIDFPQALHPNQNPQAYALFQRDLVKMDQYFKPFGFSLESERLAPLLWNKYRYLQSEDYLYDLPDQLDMD
jgi:RIO kinase 1